MRVIGRLGAAAIGLALAFASTALAAGPVVYPKPMLEAGARALGEALGASSLPAADLPAAAAAEKLAGAVFEAMERADWRPAETAIQDGTAHLMGVWKGGEFLQGSSLWVVRDFDNGPVTGEWSITEWLGTEPAYWTPMPPPPGSAASPSQDALAAGAAMLGSVLPALGTSHEEIAADVFAAMSAAEWQPIESAPKNGERILVGVDRSGEFMEAITRWLAEEAGWESVAWLGAPPTHWVALPPAPSDHE